MADWLPALLSAIFGGSIVGGIASLFKVKAEAGQIVVSAAQGALMVQTGVLQNQQKEITRLNEEVAKRDIRIEGLMENLNKRLDGLQATAEGTHIIVNNQRTVLLRLNAELRERIARENPKDEEAQEAAKIARDEANKCAAAQKQK